MSSSSLKTNWTSHHAFMPLNYWGTSDNSEDSGVAATFFLPFRDPILAGFSSTVSACFLDLRDCKLIMIVVGKRGCSRVARGVIETQWISRGSWKIDKTPMQSVAVHRTPKAIDHTHPYTPIFLFHLRILMIFGLPSPCPDGSSLSSRRFIIFSSRLRG